jgi:hypothetical protein
MTSKNFQKNMVDQNQEIIFEVIKVSGNWVFPAAKSIVEATRGKNMYLRLTDDGRSDIFRLDYVKDGENTGETVFGFVGNGGMDLVELTATTDGAGVTTGSWDYEPGEGPAGEAIGNLGQPLQWKGPATVAQLNAGITGIQPGWTYTLTDAGTLTDGSIAVEAGDEVAWTEDDEWFKVGGDSAKIAVFECTYSEEIHSYIYPSFDEINAVRLAGKLPVIVEITPVGGRTYYVAAQMSAYMNNAKFRFVDAETGTMVKLEGPTSNPVWSRTSADGITNWGDKTESDLVSGALTIDGGNSITKLTLATVQALTVKANEGTPNFALEIDNTGNSNDVTVTVKDSTGTTTLNASVAGGDTVGAGKYVQLTCVGSCWTLAEFAMPTP